MNKVLTDRKEKDRRFKRAVEFLKSISAYNDIPKRAAIFFWSEEELSSLFTKERLRLLRKVKERAYSSITELAKEVGRDVSIVRKDLKLLEEYGLIKLERVGNGVRVSTDKEGIYVPLIEAKPLEDYVEEAAS